MAPDPATPPHPSAAGRPVAHARRSAGTIRAAAALPLAGTLLGLLLTACAGSNPHPAGQPSRPNPTATTTRPTTPDTTTPDATTPDATTPGGTTPDGPPPGTWPTYQAGPARLGVAAAVPAPLTPIRRAWTASLDGSAVYGQPLVAGGRVIVATEDDNIYALDPHDGSVVWHVNLGTPLTDVAARVGCGDVDPLGITSTPVVDTTKGVLYVVGEVSTGGRAPVRHEMAAVDVRTGRVLEVVDVDPPLPAGESPLYLLQRAALALGKGRVYIGYGGHYGDCGTYHGWLVSVPTGAAGAATETAFNVTPASSGGAIWGSGAAPAVAADGSVFVTTGNPNSGGPGPWAEAVVELPAELGASPLAAFQDRQASGDLDLATGGPVLLPGGVVFAVGKTDIGYRLRRSDLGVLPAVRGTVCGSDPDGGAAFDAGLGTLYVPCRDGGIQEIDLKANRTGWRSGAANSTPILAGGRIWALAYPTGRLQEIDPATGRVLSSIAVGDRVPTFASPSAADGLLLVPTRHGVTAYCGPAGPPARAGG